MKEIQYGRLINGKLYACPDVLYDGNRVIINPPEELILAHGYKKVRYLSSSDSHWCGKLVWEESDQSITQTLIETEIDDDPVSDFRVHYFEKYKQFRNIHDIIDNIHIYREKVIDEWGNRNPLFKLLYSYLIKQYPDKTLDELVSMLWIEDDNSWDLTEYGKTILSVPPVAQTIEMNHIEGVNAYTVAHPFILVQPEVHRYEQLQCSMIFCYLHSLLDDFISKAIRLCIVLHPLGAELTINIAPKELFECFDIDNLKDKAIDDKIDKLGHDNFQAKMEFLRKRGIIPSIPKEEYEDDMILFCECRNVLVHNAGIVNQSFISRLANTKYKNQYKAGDNIVPTPEYVKQVCRRVFDLLTDLYEVIVEKYSENRRDEKG